jgi:Putative beta barrel porin-7 (BBP7)
MKHAWVISVSGLLFSAAVSRADDAPPAPSPKTEKPVPALGPTLPSLESFCKPCGNDPAAPGAVPAACWDPCKPGPCLWFNSEYLLWWIKNGNVPIPLAETGSSLTGSFHAGTPSTFSFTLSGAQVVLGDAPLDYGSFTGFRETVGGWLDGEQSTGVEVGGFFLGQRSLDGRVNSDALGNPPLVVPYQQLNGSPALVVVASPPIVGSGPLAGGISTSSSSRLWGLESNALVNLARNDAYRLDLLAGVRYLDLSEAFGLGAYQEMVAPGEEVRSVLTTTADGFQTRNQFYGCQVGARASYAFERLSMDIQATLALGSTHEVLNINGVSTFIGINQETPSPTPGGIFAQQSNSGRFTRDQFAAVPELRAQFNYRLTRWLAAFVGYDFTYWSNVVRPADQLNPSFNLPGSQILGTLTGLGGVSSRPEPAPLFNTTDFWAQGISFGLLVRF